MPRRFLVSVLALAAAGCAADRAADPITVRDSAGIEIVEHGATALTAATVWTIESEPMLDLGVVDGDPAYQFYRVVGGMRLDDGRLVIANGGSAELRFYAEDGTHLMSVGGEGEGPAEFGFPWNVWRVAEDSIGVYDMGLQRISVWSDHGVHGRIARLSPAFMNEPQLVGTFADGDMLLYDMFFKLPESGFDTIWAYIHRYGPDGASLDTVGRYPFGLLGRYEKIELVGGPAFEPRTVAAVVGETIVVGRADAYELMYLDSAADLRRIVRWHGDDLAVTAADMDAFRTAELARAVDDDDRRETENFLASQPESKSFPAYDELITDRTGHLWVRSFARPAYDGPALYTIFAPDGRGVARAELPAAFRVLEIGADYVLATTRDELDVEHVVLYRLRKDTAE